MIILDDNKKIPLYEQLFWELRREILSGELEKNSKLKPIRVLANEMDISRNTVNRAYQQLLAEGYIRAVQGSGYYIEDLHVLPGVNLHINYNEGNDRTSKGNRHIQYDFRYDKFDNNSFPWNKWRRYVQDAITERSYVKTISYVDNQGDLALRQSICRFVNRNRAVNCIPDQIIITSGTPYVMEIIAMILPDSDHILGIEEPGDRDVRQFFLDRNYKIQPISLTENGIDANQVEQTDCTLLYLTPSHQFPMGMVLSPAKRQQIIEWSNRKNSYIIEDDFESEFLYGRRPIVSMQSMDTHERVIYIDRLVTTLTPELCCCTYMVLPESLLEVYHKKYSYYYSPMSAYEQLALANFIDDGHLEHQIRKRSRLNQKKYEIFCMVMDRELSEDVSYQPTLAGTHVMIRILGFDNQQELIGQLESYGIRIYETASYWYDRSNAAPDMYLMGFNCIPLDQMEKACMKFVSALRDIKRTRTSKPGK